MTKLDLAIQFEDILKEDVNNEEYENNSYLQLLTQSYEDYEDNIEGYVYGN